MKLVSVIIPVYNVEKYIAFTIRSVLAQTYKNFEIIIVNDGSLDRSIEICQQFPDKRIKIVQQQNKGVSAARNAGIVHAKGEYFAFLDGDDLWVPQKLEKHIQHLERSPHVGVSFSYSAFIDDLGHSIGMYQISKLKGITPSLILCRNPVGNGSTPVIRREVFEDIKLQSSLQNSKNGYYFDEQLHHIEDVECWLRIALQTNWQIEGIPEALTLYRISNRGASTNFYKQLESLEKVLEKTYFYAPDIVAQRGRAAKAYQLRFLARRAVSLEARPTALKFIYRALFTYWRLLIEEPRRTLITLLAAHLLFLLPKPLFYWLKNVAMKKVGSSQNQHFTKKQVTVLSAIGSKNT